MAQKNATSSASGTENSSVKQPVVAALPYREISINVKDSEGRLISAQAIHLNKGDAMFFDIDINAFVHSHVERKNHK